MLENNGCHSCYSGGLLVGKLVYTRQRNVQKLYWIWNALAEVIFMVHLDAGVNSFMVVVVTLRYLPYGSFMSEQTRLGLHIKVIIVFLL